MSKFDKKTSLTGKELETVDSLIQSKRFREASAELEKLPCTFNPEIVSIEAAFYHYLKGYIFWVLGEKKRGYSSAQKAMEMYLTLCDLDGIAKSQKLAGSLLIDLGNLTSAKEHLELSVSAFKLANRWGQAARALNQMAYLSKIRGQLKYANDYNAEARQCALLAQDKYYETVLRGSLSWHQFLEGDWKSAKVSLKDFLLETKRANDFGNHALGLVNFGRSEFLGSRFKESRKYYLEAVQICNKENLIGTLKIVYEHLAELSIAEGRFSEAEDYLKKAMEIGERVSPYGTIMTQCWRLMGDLHLAKREYDQALKAYETCRSYLIKLPERLEEGAMYRGMGICYIHKDQLSLAQTAFKKALEIFEACENDWELAKTYVEAAEWGVFALAEFRPKLVWAKGIFKELEHPSWETRVQLLLGRSEPLSAGLPLRLAHEVADRERIRQALTETEANISQAAGKLGITRQALHYKIKRYKIDL